MPVSAASVNSCVVLIGLLTTEKEGPRLLQVSITFPRSIMSVGARVYGILMDLGHKQNS